MCILHEYYIICNICYNDSKWMILPFSLNVLAASGDTPILQCSMPLARMVACGGLAMLPIKPVLVIGTSLGFHAVHLSKGLERSGRWYLHRLVYTVWIEPL